MRNIARASVWLIAILIVNSRAQSQYFDTHTLSSTRFGENGPIGSLAIDSSLCCNYWPESTVKEPTVTSVELSTGKLLWAKPAQLALPPTFKIEEGWLLYESTDGEQIERFRTDGFRTLHIVHGVTGVEATIPYDPDRNSIVERPMVHRDRCVTGQGLVVNCADGTVVGDLGPGEHQILVSNGRIYVLSNLFDQLNVDRTRSIFREFDLGRMTVEQELEISVDNAWEPVAARDDVIIVAGEMGGRSNQMVCFDLAKKSERWRTTLPRSIRPSPCFWRDDSKLVLTMGSSGLVCPLLIDLETGNWAPETQWRDPRSLLSWHNDLGVPADLVASNDSLILGRWRNQVLMCVNAQTGKLEWSQRSSDYMIARTFSQKPWLGDFFVAESRLGYDIISVATGERRSVLPEQLGLELSDDHYHRSLLDDPGVMTENESEMTEVSKVLFGTKTADRVWDWVFILIPAIPVFIWIVWSLIRWQNPSHDHQDTNSN